MIRLLEQDPAIRKVALGSASGFLAFGFGSGLSRYAPGTVGTLAAVPVAMVLKQLPAAAYWPVLLLLFLLGIRLCGDCSRRLGRKDPGGIVWDEIVAYCMTVAFIPFQWAWWLAAFGLFRLFDILKPWPIKSLEKRFGGGMGIMLDDVVAAVMAMAVLALAERFF